MSARYFTPDQVTPPTLLRTGDYVEEAFINGRWRPTR